MTDEAHDTSVAVWDIPAPVVRDRPFRVKVGVVCSAECPLGGHEIAVHDGEGTSLARARLSDAPWPGTSALYWMEVELHAPASEGHQTWQVRCNADHSFAASFSFIIDRQPEHAVTIEAIDRAAGMPVERVELHLGPYRATTDGNGVATIAVPGGSYDVAVWKVGYEASPVTVAVEADITVRIDMHVVRRAEQPYWM